MTDRKPGKKEEGEPRKEPPSKELNADYSKDWRDADIYKDPVNPPIVSGNDR